MPPNKKYVQIRRLEPTKRIILVKEIQEKISGAYFSYIFEYPYSFLLHLYLFRIYEGLW